MPGNILIIGHGYIGGALARGLHAGERPVAVMNRSPEETDGYPLHEGDVGDLDAVKSVRDRMVAKPDAIVHCASSGRGGADAYRRVFLEGLTHLRTVFPDTPIFFTSSTSVYGQTDGSVVTEQSETAPDRETSRILVEAEHLARESGGAALRLAGIYGPGRSIYLKRILSGDATIEAGPVSRLVNQIHRDDAVSAITHLVDCTQSETAGAVFNVVDDTPLSQRECYQRLAYLLDLPVPPEAPPDLNRKRAWTHKAVSNGALKATGWTPRYPSFFHAVENDPELIPSIREQID